MTIDDYFKRAGIVTVIGAALIAVGSFMPWATATAGIFSVSKSGMEGDGIFTLILAIPVALLGLGMMGVIGRNNSAPTVVLLLGVLTALLAGYEMWDISEAGAEIGSGLGAVAIGALTICTGGVLGKQSEENERNLNALPSSTQRDTLDNGAAPGRTD